MWLLNFLFLSLASIWILQESAFLVCIKTWSDLKSIPSSASRERRKWVEVFVLFLFLLCFAPRDLNLKGFLCLGCIGNCRSSVFTSYLTVWFSQKMYVFHILWVCLRVNSFDEIWGRRRTLVNSVEPMDKPPTLFFIVVKFWTPGLMNCFTWRSLTEIEI